VDITGAVFETMMEAAAVSSAIVVQTSTVYGSDNNYLADAVAERPDRYAGIASVNPLSESCGEDLRYWVEERGLCGTRLFAAGASIGMIFSLDDPSLEKFWLSAQSLGIPVDLQVRYMDLPAVENAARRYSDVPLVLDHIGGAPVTGGPPYLAASHLFELAAYPQIHVKFSNHNLDAAESESSTAGDMLRAIIQAYGADRVLWGSNFPNTFGRSPATLETYVGLVQRALRGVAPLAEEEQHALMGGTAAAVYLGRTPTKLG
jgi:predicted TIM-barrel fold metal-dependent hydrolase